jgi:hypothetical protein
MDVEGSGCGLSWGTLPAFILDTKYPRSSATSQEEGKGKYKDAPLLLCLTLPHRTLARWLANSRVNEARLYVAISVLGGNE